MKSKRFSTDKSIYASYQRRAKTDATVQAANESEQRDAAAAAATGDTVNDGGQTTSNTVSQHNDDDPEHRLTRVMSGCLDNLPPLQPKVVRIFTSSTFTGQSATQQQWYLTACTAQLSC